MTPQPGAAAYGVCAKHGLRYDPTTQAGCVVCRRAATSWSARPVLWLIVSLAAVGLLIHTGVRNRERQVLDKLRIQAREQAEAISNENVITPVVRPKGPETPIASIDPEPYRVAIEDLERLLYKPSRREAAQEADLIEGAAVRLAAQLQTTVPVAQRDVMLDIIAYGGRVSDAKDAGEGFVSPAARDGWVRDWEILRDRIFRPALWFHARKHTTVDSGVTLLESVAKMRATATKLGGLIESARRDSNSFGLLEVTVPDLKGQGDVVPADASVLLARWRAWVTDWQRRVESTAEALPSSEMVAKDPTALGAHEELGKVVRSLSAVPDPGAGAPVSSQDPDVQHRFLPSAAARTQWLDAGARALTTVRGLLERLP